jgi:hypothetical protein
MYSQWEFSFENIPSGNPDPQPSNLPIQPPPNYQPTH